MDVKRVVQGQRRLCQHPSKRGRLQAGGAWRCRVRHPAQPAPVQANQQLNWRPNESMWRGRADPRTIPIAPRLFLRHHALLFRRKPHPVQSEQEGGEVGQTEVKKKGKKPKPNPRTTNKTQPSPARLYPSSEHPVSANAFPCSTSARSLTIQRFPRERAGET